MKDYIVHIVPVLMSCFPE